MFQSKTTSIEVYVFPTRKMFTIEINNVIKHIII